MIHCKALSDFLQNRTSVMPVMILESFVADDTHGSLRVSCTRDLYNTEPRLGPRLGDTEDILPCS